MARHLMEDGERAFFEPFIVAIRARAGHPASDHRLVLDGIFWAAHTGALLRDLPSSLLRQYLKTGQFNY